MCWVLQQFTCGLTGAAVWMGISQSQWCWDIRDRQDGRDGQRVHEDMGTIKVREWVKGATELREKKGGEQGGECSREGSAARYW